MSDDEEVTLIAIPIPNYGEDDDDDPHPIPLRAGTNVIKQVKFLEEMYPDDPKNAITTALISVLYLAAKNKLHPNPLGIASMMAQAKGKPFDTDMDKVAAAEAAKTDAELQALEDKRLAAKKAKKKKKSFEAGLKEAKEKLKKEGHTVH